MFGHCRYCNGMREFTTRQCLGCGSPKVNAMVPAASLNKSKTFQCPKCRSNRTSGMEDERHVCADCKAVFEADDFGYLDSRPEENAIKRERGRLHGR